MLIKLGVTWIDGAPANANIFNIRWNMRRYPIWFFAHLEGCFEKKKMHWLILKYWRSWFPRLPSYQTFVLRLNRLEPTFQTLGADLSGALAATRTPELDHLVDSLPVMLAHCRANAFRIPNSTWARCVQNLEFTRRRSGARKRRPLSARWRRTKREDILCWCQWAGDCCYRR